MEKPIQFGKFRIQSPCLVPEEEMDTLAQGNTFCHQCKKVVHEIGGLRPKEIQALMKLHGGKLCGSFTRKNPPLAYDLPNARVYNVMKFWRLGAASIAATSLLFLQPALANRESNLPETTFSPLTKPLHDAAGLAENPLLLTGVILDLDSNNLRDDILIHVTFQNGDTTILTSHRGLFSLPLQADAQPDDKIIIRIDAQTIESEHGWTHTYGEAKLKTSVKKAQNVTLSISAHYPEDRRLRGDIER